VAQRYPRAGNAFTQQQVGEERRIDYQGKPGSRLKDGGQTE
jgi:hypothetical protein